MPTVAIHLIWTTYGTWLPGDARGHWSPLFDVYGRLIAAGHQLNAPDPISAEVAKSSMREPERVLAPEDELLVANVISDEVRCSDLVAYACAIERTHVHLLIRQTPHQVGTLVGRMKSRSSSAICGYALDLDRNRTWSGGYWRVFLFQDDAVPFVQNYVEEHNVRRGMPRVRFDWVLPFAK